MQTQIRRYQIMDGRLDDFVEAWIHGVVPLRRSFGFRIDGAWQLPGSNEFVWLLSYYGEDGFEAADARYYASDDRKRLHPDPAAWISGGEKADAVRVL